LGVVSTKLMMRFSRCAVYRGICLLIAAGALLFLIVGAMPGSASRPVDIYINTNGLATIRGISLGKGAVRTIALRTLRWAKMPVRVLTPSQYAPPGYKPGGPIDETNLIQTLDAIIKSGLIATNKPSGPSPYE